MTGDEVLGQRRHAAGFGFDREGVLHASVSADGTYPDDAQAERHVTVDIATEAATTVADYTGGLTDAAVRAPYVRRPP